MPVNNSLPARYLRAVEWISAPGASVNDDRAGTCQNYAWVIDGATDCPGEKYLPGCSDAAWIAERFHNYFLKRAPEESPPLTDVLSEITAQVAADFQLEHIRELKDRGRQPSAAGLIGRLRPGAFEVISLGDCQLFVAQPGKPAQLMGVDRSRLGDKAAIERTRQVMKDHNLDWKAAREKLHGRGVEGRRAMNKPGGYSVLSIDMPPYDLIHRETIPVESGTRILMATDGFTRLYEVFDAYSEETLLEAGFEKGLAALVAQLRSLEKDDPSCEKAARLKTHDDATAILAILE